MREKTEQEWDEEIARLRKRAAMLKRLAELELTRKPPNISWPDDETWEEYAESYDRPTDMI